MKTPTPTPTLYLAIELSLKTWKLGFSTSHQAKPRIVSIPAREMGRLFSEIGKAKQKFALPEDAPVRSVYEAGRDGFWIHRILENRGIENLVVDPGSIEQSKRKRAKTDGLDVRMLLNRLLRWEEGDRHVWAVARAPSAHSEGERVNAREWKDLQKNKSRTLARVRSVLIRYGIVLDRIHPGKLREELPTLRGPCDTRLPKEEQRALCRMLDRLELLMEQIKELEQERKERLENPQSDTEHKAAKLMRFKGVGAVSAEGLAAEFFFRDFRNRRQVGAAAGLTGTPYASGETSRETGISKQGNKRVRTLMVELAWLWLRYQPDSSLSRWYMERFGGGTSRQRRIGIVALARKLLVALWKYLERDEIPGGAVLMAV